MDYSGVSGNGRSCLQFVDRSENGSRVVLRFGSCLEKSSADASGNDFVQLDESVAPEAAYGNAKFIDVDGLDCRYILRTLFQKDHLVHLPGYIVDLQNKIHRVSNEMQQGLERDPFIEEIADQLDEPLKKIQLAVATDHSPLSLDEKVDANPEGEFRLMDCLEAQGTERHTEIGDRLERVEVIKQMLHGLKSQEREVLSHYFGLDGQDDQNMAEIGREMGLSRERVRQIKSEALKHLKDKWKN